MIGPTGSGKTLLARPSPVCSMFLLPLRRHHPDRGGLRGRGCGKHHRQSPPGRGLRCGEDQRGIVYIDEIDKIARKSDSPSITRDVSARGATGAPQDPRGNHCQCAPKGGRKHPQRNSSRLTPQYPLHLWGAFVGLEGIIKSRIGVKAMGFSADIKKRGESKLGDILAEVQPEDLIKYGMIPSLSDASRLSLPSTSSPKMRWFASCSSRKTLW